jgi:hypothetical protein
VNPYGSIRFSLERSSRLAWVPFPTIRDGGHCGKRASRVCSMPRPWVVPVVILAAVATGCGTASTTTTTSTVPTVSSQSACGVVKTYLDDISSSQLDDQEIATARKSESNLLSQLELDATAVRSSALASGLRQFVSAARTTHDDAFDQRLASVRQACQRLGFTVT